MASKIVLLIFIALITVACGDGAKIHFTKPEIEQLGEGTYSEGITSPSTGMSGTLIRSSQNDGTDTISSGGKSFRIGKYSSASTFTFVQSRPLGSSTNVKIQGSSTKETGHAPNTSASVEVLTIQTLTAQ